MTWNIALIGLVAAVGLIHLVTTAVQALAGLRSRRAKNEQRLLAAGGERGDWYVFFHCAELLGRETNKKAAERDERRQAADPKPPQRDPARRPRPRISL
ncbi:MAG: hypothetical protein LBD10_12315 [Desulfobulbus sp.]|jgi:hypothetical protein|uniref:hypothetical protein n=1 Tax=Desulfobulbus sp. TaxID=895 RepID=UPI0028491D41|nr:hypothetical protein [Desulfobulbus sp.]MDR2550972.1 hypothetical protein [Desulfobulbus sp.]